jgi:putative thioredoxin
MSNPQPGGNLRGAVDLSSLVRPPAGSEAAPAGVVFEATDASFTAVLDLSARVPVIVEFYGQGIQPALGPVIESYGGRFALATIDGTANAQLVQAFQVQQVPTVAAVVAGRPVQLFTGVIAEDELRSVLEQVLQLAAQQGATGTIPVGDDGEPADEPLPPHHQEAYDAIASGDFATAIKEYETAIAQNPRDLLAVAGLAQVRLLQRLDGADAEAIRAAAAAQTPAARSVDPGPQLAVADLEVSDGQLDDAFGRLLDLFPTLDAAGKNLVRTRLLDYFEIAGGEDPRVVAARRRLTGLLY